VSESVVNGAGHAVDSGLTGLFGNLSTVSGSGVHILGVDSCPNLVPSDSQLRNPSVFSGLVARCGDQLHLTDVVVYQPSNRYWLFQVYESLIFFALALAVGSFTVWWVRRLD
jgi:hypothetical protein